MTDFIMDHKAHLENLEKQLDDLNNKLAKQQQEVASTRDFTLKVTGAIEYLKEVIAMEEQEVKEVEQTEVTEVVEVED